MLSYSLFNSPTSPHPQSLSRLLQSRIHNITCIQAIELHLRLESCPKFTRNHHRQNFPRYHFQSQNMLLVMIDREQQRLALPAEAHWDDHGIFSWFGNEPNLLVTVVIGAGDKAFCTGQEGLPKSRYRGKIASDRLIQFGNVQASMKGRQSQGLVMHALVRDKLLPMAWASMSSTLKHLTSNSCGNCLAFP